MMVMSGSEKAAMLLLMMGEDKAAEVLRHVSSDEVERIGMAMAAIKDVHLEQAVSVIDTFEVDLAEQLPLALGLPNYVRNVLVNTLGDSNGKTLADKVLGDEQTLEISSLRWLDLDTVVHMLKEEHPQIIAITLAHMDQSQAGYVLDKLEQSLQEDVVMRIATMDKIPQAAIVELQEILDKKLAISSSFKSKQIDGSKLIAGIIKGLSTESETRVVEMLAKTDPAMAERIKELMFVFDNLLDIDDKGIQRLLRDVPGDTLTVALKGANPLMRDKVFKNMSKRAGEMLNEDMESRGPVKLSEVEVAQKEMVGIARALAEAGEINLGGKGEDLVE